MSITSQRELAADTPREFITPWMAKLARGTDTPSDAATSDNNAGADRLSERQYRRRATFPAYALFAITFLLIILHQGRALALFYPVAAIGVAILIFRRSPAHYVSLVFWLTFLTPEVRRFSDYFNGAFSERSLIMLAPIVACALCGVRLLTHGNVLFQRRGAPLLLIALSVIYGYFIGIIVAGFAAATYELVTWLTPLFLGFHVLVSWKHYKDFYRVLMKTFVYGGFLMAAYGVYQYVDPPPWDVFWLAATEITSAGKAVPFGLRIMSTMNSTGPFANTMMVCLLVSLVARTRSAALGGVLGLAALVVTLVRSAIGGFGVGVLYLLVMLDGRSRLRIILGIAAIVLLCSPAIMIDQVSDRLSDRLSSTNQLDDDTSYQVRLGIYDHFLKEMTTNIAGQGLGTVGMGSKLSADNSTANVDFDSGLMEVPYVLGWPGTLLYVAGIVMLIMRAVGANLQLKHDRFVSGMAAGGFAILSLMVFVNTLTGSSGMIFFVGMILPVVSLRYNRNLPQPSATTYPDPADNHA